MSVQDCGGKHPISLGQTGMPPERPLPFLLRDRKQPVPLAWQTHGQGSSPGAPGQEAAAGELRARMPLTTRRPVDKKEELVQWPSLDEKTASESWDTSPVPLHLDSFLSTAQFTAPLYWTSVAHCHVLTGLPSLPRGSWPGTIPNKEFWQGKLLESGTV